MRDDGGQARDEVGADAAIRRPVSTTDRPVPAVPSARSGEPAPSLTPDPGLTLGPNLAPDPGLVSGPSPASAAFRPLAEVIADGVVVHQDGRVVYANPAAARMVGRP